MYSTWKRGRQHGVVRRNSVTCSGDASRSNGGELQLWGECRDGCSMTENGLPVWLGGYDTYIGMSPDLLNDLVVKVTGVTQQATGDVVGVLETLKEIVCNGELRTLAELGPLVLAGSVDVLDPGVVGGRVGVLDVLLEDDNVRVWNLLGVDRGDDGSCVIVDGAGVEDRGSCREQRQHREDGGGLHDGPKEGRMKREMIRRWGDGEQAGMERGRGMGRSGAWMVDGAGASFIKSRRRQGDAIGE